MRPNQVPAQRYVKTAQQTRGNKAAPKLDKPQHIKFVEGILES